MSTQVKAEVLLRLGLHLSTHAEKETRYIQYEPLVNGSKDESIDYINN
jgi:hypothetical protein